mmetsp:Transcript_19809/g.53030  ORF Transcript_19809/g.53030 Transcript_19809/m.53030 type:complete len:243 (+) Transcript_19809:3072-3800(+)
MMLLAVFTSRTAHLTVLPFTSVISAGMFSFNASAVTPETVWSTVPKDFVSPTTASRTEPGISDVQRGDVELGGASDASMLKNCRTASASRSSRFTSCGDGVYGRKSAVHRLFSTSLPTTMTLKVWPGLKCSPGFALKVSASKCFGQTPEAFQLPTDTSTPKSPMLFTQPEYILLSCKSLMSVMNAPASAARRTDGLRLNSATGLVLCCDSSPSFGAKVKLLANTTASPRSQGSPPREAPMAT